MYKEKIKDLYANIAYQVLVRQQLQDYHVYWMELYLMIIDPFFVFLEKLVQEGFGKK